MNTRITNSVRLADGMHREAFGGPWLAPGHLLLCTLMGCSSHPSRAGADGASVSPTHASDGSEDASESADEGPPDGASDGSEGVEGASPSDAGTQASDRAEVGPENDSGLDVSSAGDGGPSITLSPNPNSVLSQIVSFALPGASTARVISSSSAEQLATPHLVLGADGRGTYAVLGLNASTAYNIAAQGLTIGGLALTTDSAAAQTAALPAELASLNLAITQGSGAPQSGYYLVSGTGNDTFAVDASGAIRWYRAFSQSALEAKMQADGTFTSYVGASAGWQAVAGQYMRYAPDGTLISMYAAASPDMSEPGAPTVYTDPHEALLTVDASGQEHLHLIAYEQRPFSASNASATAWHEIVRQSEDGAVEFRWKSWSRFSANDQLESDITGDLDHTNALAIDPADGNYIVSLRNLDALVKIDSQTGNVLWQLGGNQNQFTFMNDPQNGFQGQHSVRVLADGDILLYDNGVRYNPAFSRAVEYRLDTGKMTATLVWQFRHSPDISTRYLGSVERLQNGDTLIAFGAAGVVDEVDEQGQVVWEGQLRNGTSSKSAYRIRRLPSLYAYVTP